MGWGIRFAPCPPPATRAPPLSAQNAYPNPSAPIERPAQARGPARASEHQARVAETAHSCAKRSCDTATEHKRSITVPERCRAFLFLWSSQMAYWLTVLLDNTLATLPLSDATSTPPNPQTMTIQHKADAGDFDVWLHAILTSFREGTEVDVACGECRGCCSAGRFVHLTPADQAAHSNIPKQFLLRVPGFTEGHAVMGYLDGGACPMLKAGDCSIYPSRPSTCRTFDCRVLTATGLLIDGKWNERINKKVKAWEFSFSSPDGQRRLTAMKDAAAFIRRHAALFPGGRAPSEPTTLAVLAIKVHPVFLSPVCHSSPLEIANAIVTESRRFEAVRSECVVQPRT